MSKNPLWHHAPRLTLAAALAAVVGYLAFDLVVKPKEPPPAAPVSHAIAEVPLIDDTGKPTNLAAFAGRWVVVFFGYAACPDICPTSLAYLSKELKQLGSSADRVKGVFISLDPKRDKPEALGRYVHFFDPSMAALSGSEEQLQRLTKLLGVYAKVQPANKDAPETAYTMAHTASFFILTPDGQLQQTLSPPFASGALAATLRSAVQAAAH